MKETLQIAVFQMNSIWKSPEKNLAQLASFLSSNTQAIDLLVLPEMWPTGFVMDPKESALDAQHPVTHGIKKLAAKHEVDIVGSIPYAEDGNFYNRAMLIRSDGKEDHYDKQYLFSPSGENIAYKAGTYCPTIDYNGWQLKLQICYDLRFPESVRDQIQSDLIIYVANWPSARLYHWNMLLIARAIENQCYVVGCNRTGSDGNGWDFPGGSSVIDYTGKVLTTHPSDTLLQTIHRVEAIQYREKLPFYKDKK